MECGFSDIFSSHICSTVAETIDVTNYEATFGAKNVQKATFEAAEMILGPWDQEVTTPRCKYYDFKGQPFQYDMKKITLFTLHGSQRNLGPSCEMKMES